MFRRRRTSKDFQAEIEAHLQLETERLREQGITEAQASGAARRAFGNVTSAQERFYESTGWFHGEVFRDICFSLRMLVKNPGATAVAVITLALGIGANTAIFSLLNAVLLRSLPVPQPRQLMLFGRGEWVGSQDALPDRSWQLFSYPFFREFREKNEVFSDVAAIDSISFDSHGHVGGGGSLEKVRVELVSGSYFHTLGVNAVIGRTLTAADDQTPGGHPLAVATYSWWQRRFGGNPGIVGQTVTIGSTIYTVTGVTAPGFSGVMVGNAPDVWIPLAMEKEISPGWNGLNRNLFQSLYLIGRRKPGVSAEQASANTNLLFTQILKEYVGAKPSAKELENIRRARVDLTSAANGLSQVRLQFASPLTILMVVVLLVLLIACGNVANLLLAWASSRRRELAVRMSIGAGRARLVRQLLVENGLLALGGAILGALLAWGIAGLLLPMAAPGSQPLAIRVTPDLRVLLFTLGMTVLTVLLFGVGPTLYATRLELAPALKDRSGAAGPPTHSRLSRALVIGEVSLSLVLLLGAVLFLRSLTNLLNVDTGFDRRNVLVMSVDPSATGYQVGPRLESMMEQVEKRVGSIPGIQGASFVFSTFGGGWTTPLTVPGRLRSERNPDVFHNVIGPDYLKVMKIPVVLGRSLEERDDFAAQKVAVITETAARTYFPGESPIGMAFSLGSEPEWQNIKVVGVARDVKFMSVRQREMPVAFYPHAQHGMFLYNVVAHVTGDPGLAIAGIRKAIQAVDAGLPVSDARTLEQEVNNSVLNQRLVAQLTTLFGLLAAFLSCVGIYSLVSYGVAQRTNEFGIRMALGAERTRVLWMVIREALKLVLTGAVMGLVLAAGSGRLLRNALFGLGPYDPFSIGLTLVVIVGTAAVAAYLPARRATRIDPLEALRYE